jgi:formylmethanofuran dehydrogenase subunit E
MNFLSNYPEDIRNYDDHPNSPFYVAKSVICSVCGEEYDPSEILNKEDGTVICEACEYGYE